MKKFFSISLWKSMRGRTTYGYFTTREKAEKVIQDRLKEGKVPEYWAEYLEIHEHDLDDMDTNVYY